MMSAGNGFCYEQWLAQAERIARENNVDVLLYNPRGVGLSLGAEYDTDDAVEDCKAVIKYALKDNGWDEVGVFGLSLGGGITATALREMQNEQAVGRIGLYINCESFPSIHECLKGMTGIPAIVCRIGLAILGINPLSGAEDLVNRELADITAVITAEEDQIMKGEGRLANYLERYKNSVLYTDSPVQNIEFYTEENALHGMYSQNTINDLIKKIWGAAVAKAEPTY